MARLITQDPQGNVLSVVEVEVKGYGWVTEPGGPGPDSDEAKAFFAQQEQLMKEGTQNG